MNDFVDGDRFEDNMSTRAQVERHWKTLESGNLDAEHWLYHDDAVLEYPQSAEVIVGRDNIKAARAAGPRRNLIKPKTVIGQDDLWVTEYKLLQDGKTVYAISIMEFRGDKVERETVYYADQLAAPAWRAAFVKKPA